MSGTQEAKAASPTSARECGPAIGSSWRCNTATRRYADCAAGVAWITDAATDVCCANVAGSAVAKQFHFVAAGFHGRNASTSLGWTDARSLFPAAATTVTLAGKLQLIAGIAAADATSATFADAGAFSLPEQLGFIASATSQLDGRLGRQGAGEAAVETTTARQDRRSAPCQKTTKLKRRGGVGADEEETAEVMLRDLSGTELVCL